MQTSQNDHNAAVAIKTGTSGWLTGAPLQAEQADVAASQQALDQAMAMQLQLQQQAEQMGTSTGHSQHVASVPWLCGPDPCTH